MRRWALVLLVGILPVRAHAQLLGVRIEEFIGGGVVAGVSTVQIGDITRTLVHAGARADVGIQGEHVGGGLGLRYWEFKPTAALGGDGLDLFAQVELRQERAARTTLRLAVGIGGESFDGGKSGSGFMSSRGYDQWSIGLGYELPVSVEGRALLTLDLINPSHATDTAYRKAPVLEIGAAFRVRSFQGVLPLPGRR